MNILHIIAYIEFVLDLTSLGHALPDNDLDSFLSLLLNRMTYHN